MEQRKRRGGNSGLGYYSSWEKSKDNGCIYCGKPATTREHAPSKVFLLMPYPENLPTIPACSKCNNEYSKDEKYVACFLDYLKRRVYVDYSRQEQDDRLSKDDTLRILLSEQIKACGGKIQYQPDEQRIVRILIKLARCHAGFEFDYVDFDDDHVSVSYDFLFNMSEDVMLNFNLIPEMNTVPEIGSRGVSAPFIVQNIETGEAAAFAFWNDVQENQYRYQVSFDDGGGIAVKIVIYEFLYCKVIFE